jgi:DNA-binding MarR family transcriptional regulator
MSLEQKAQIIQAAASGSYGVRDLAKKLRWRTSSIVSLLRELQEERLIDFSVARKPSRGRPKRSVVCTPLGLDLLKAYGRLEMMPLRARKADLERAVKDALYTQRLVDSGHSAFMLFMELNTIVCSIRNSSEAH